MMTAIRGVCGPVFFARLRAAASPLSRRVGNAGNRQPTGSVGHHVPRCHHRGIPGAALATPLCGAGPLIAGPRSRTTGDGARERTRPRADCSTRPLPAKSPIPARQGIAADRVVVGRSMGAVRSLAHPLPADRMVIGRLRHCGHCAAPAPRQQTPVIAFMRLRSAIRRDHIRARRHPSLRKIFLQSFAALVDREQDRSGCQERGPQVSPVSITAPVVTARSRAWPLLDSPARAAGSRF